MSAEKSVNVRISNELNKFIIETIEKISPILQKVNILESDEKLGYVAASRMVALKLKKYVIPFTDEILKELGELAKDNGGKR